MRAGRPTNNDRRSQTRALSARFDPLSCSPFQAAGANILLLAIERFKSTAVRQGVSVRRRPPCCEGARFEGCDRRASFKVTRRWMGRFSGSNADGVGTGMKRPRIVEETLMPGAGGVVRWRGDTALRRACSSHGEGRRELLNRAGETVRFCCRLRSERRRPRGPRRQDSRAQQQAADERNPGMIEIELGSGSRVRVDSAVNTDGLRRVLSVLSER